MPVLRLDDQWPNPLVCTLFQEGLMTVDDVRGSYGEAVDAGASPDNLVKAQQLVDRARLQYSGGGDDILNMAKTLALIDIGCLLRDIRDELHSTRLGRKY